MGAVIYHGKKKTADCYNNRALFFLTFQKEPSNLGLPQVNMSYIVTLKLPYVINTFVMSLFWPLGSSFFTEISLF